MESTVTAIRISFPFVEKVSTSLAIGLGAWARARMTRETLEGLQLLGRVAVDKHIGAEPPGQRRPPAAAPDCHDHVTELARELNTKRASRDQGFLEPK